MNSILIAQQSARQASADILWILAVVVTLAIVVGILGWIIRKMMVGSDGAAATPGLTLADLRQMHREGRMTDEEFEAAKRLVVAQGLSMMTPPEEAGRLTDGVSDAGATDGGDDGENRPPDSDKIDNDDTPPRPA